MNMMRRLVALVLPAGLLAAAACSRSPSGEHVGSTKPSALTGDNAVTRAQEWEFVRMPYCQSANHQPDYDPACAPVCTRPDVGQWDPYRSDCSGLVSWAWGLPPPGRVTTEFAPFNGDVSFVIDAGSLSPGDAVNNNEHVMLFKNWNGPGNATFIEEPGCSSATPYAHEFSSNVGINGSSIYVAWNGMTFTAIRFNGQFDDGKGCSGAEEAACGNFGCGCGDGFCSGGYSCDGSGCSAKHTNDCAQFGCGCVDGTCSGGYCPGSGCNAKMVRDCGNYGCGCADGHCSGGYCDGSGCTEKETNDCAKYGCGCVDGRCSGGFCPGTGCTAKQTQNCAAFGCGCSMGACKGGACH